MSRAPRGPAGAGTTIKLMCRTSVPGIAALRCLALAVALALAGCGYFARTPKEACPSAVILRPLANTAVFAPGVSAPRPESVAFYGLLSEADSKCDYGSDGVRVALDVVVVAERGPAAPGDTVDLDYFVALTGPGDAILSKRSFRVRIAFEGNQKRAGVADHIEELIPSGAGKGSELTLDLGFQQSPTAIEFYKRFRGR